MTTPIARDIERAAENIRAANHATMRCPLDGPDTYSAVGNLAELLGRLPQVLDYLARSLRRADPAEHYDDRGHDPAHTLDHADADLVDARHQAGALIDHLTAAHNHLGHLGRWLSED
ncbi:hypothetical protein LQ327_11930 [Actinomycetospora endophytica]|uniref:Uncharacterized protein n=1 Tax=Actinomycetospora endophytica TaxID=2291215 RepID=A0ABS8P7W7_9PSEU|nr:hypothetical protein [Actinomycetospora endophytica]MCD2194083.1 hypothetical protein [Actinomycetospora endophytica]